MNAETLIYGLRAGNNERWQEELLIARHGLTMADIERVKGAAAKDGFHSFRVTKWNGGKPNFAATVKA